MIKVYFKDPETKKLSLVEVDTENHVLAISLVAEQYKLKSPALALLEKTLVSQEQPPEAA